MAVLRSDDTEDLKFDLGSYHWLSPLVEGVPRWDTEVSDQHVGMGCEEYLRKYVICRSATIPVRSKSYRPLEDVNDVNESANLQTHARNEELARWESSFEAVQGTVSSFFRWQ